MNQSVKIGYFFLFLTFLGLAFLFRENSTTSAALAESQVWSLKFFFLIALGAFLFLALVFDYEKGKTYAPYILAICIAKTGFSYDIKPGYATSANEVFTAMILVIWSVRRIQSRRSLMPATYFSRYVMIYIFLALAGVVIASLAFHVPPLNIFDEFKSYVLYTFYLFLLPECVQNKEEFQRLLGFIILLSLLSLYYAVTGSAEVTEFGQERLALGGWGALNIFMGYIVPVFFIASGFLLRKGGNWQKPLLALFLVAVLYAAFLSQTRSAWGALVAGTGTLIFLTRRRVLLSAAIVLLALVVMKLPAGKEIQHTIEHRIVEQTFNPNSTLQTRLDRWEIAWATVKSYPLTGSGWGGWLPLQSDGSAGDTAIELLPRWHNSYLEILSQIGAPGLLVFLLLWGKILKTEGMRLMSPGGREMVNAGLFAGVVACLTYALGEQQLYRIETASHTYFLAGLLIAGGNILNAKKLALRPPEKRYARF